MKTKVFLVLLCALLLLGVAGRSSARAQSSVVVQGIAFCYYHPSTGVWVASTNIGSGFAPWFKVSGDGHIISYRMTMVTPALISIHVGCGGSPQSWWSDNHTQDIGVDKDMVLKTYCNDTQSGTTYNCQFVPSAEAAAINWAMPNNGKSMYVGQCLQFVFDAYQYGAGLDLRKWVNVSTIGAYPQDIWDWPAHSHIMHGQFGKDTTPPAGALVFFLYAPNKYYSHVELSLGGGTMLSTDDTYGERAGYGQAIHTETIAQHDSVALSKYAGWWLPDM